MSGVMKLNECTPDPNAAYDLYLVVPDTGGCVLLEAAHGQVPDKDRLTSLLTNFFSRGAQRVMVGKMERYYEPASAIILTPNIGSTVQ